MIMQSSTAAADELYVREWSEDFSLEVCSWSYPEPYDIYNLPSYEEMCRRSIGFGDSGKRKNFRGVMLQGRLAGFFNLVDEGTEVFLGIGIRPDLCSKGYGSRVIRLAVQESRHLYGTKAVYLDVREWNHRAVKCYSSAGFRIREKLEQETYAGSGGFLRMSYDFNE